MHSVVYADPCLPFCLLTCHVSVLPSWRALVFCCGGNSSEIISRRREKKNNNNNSVSTLPVSFQILVLESLKDVTSLRVQLMKKGRCLTELRFHVPLNTRWGHFRDVLPSQSLDLLISEETETNTTESNCAETERQKHTEKPESKET